MLGAREADGQYDGYGWRCDVVFGRGAGEWLVSEGEREWSELLGDDL